MKLGENDILSAFNELDVESGEESLDFENYLKYMLQNFFNDNKKKKRNLELSFENAFDCLDLDHKSSLSSVDKLKG